MAYIQGESRSQTSLFPVSLEELIPEDHLVRVIDLYVARLDLRQLGFDKAQPKATGRPSCDPADQLKLYLYGYFQRIRSSRRPEAECQRNIEVMWLINRLKPDFKTQTAVDAEHCLIMHHEVTQDGDDRKQLEPMAKAAKAELGQDTLTVTADRGYSNGQQFQACEEASITVYVPPNRTSNPGGETLLERQDFRK
ncbi:hypothetical protein ABIE20_001812 [Pseudomonas sp. 2835]